MRRVLAIFVATGLLAGCACLSRPAGGRSSAAFAQRQDVAAEGERFVRRACAGCHAVRPTGASPNPHSPPFRTLAARLPGEALEAQLSSIAQRGHVEMPPIYMTPDEIRAVAAYIRAVREPERGLRDNT